MPTADLHPSPADRRRSTVSLSYSRSGPTDGAAVILLGSLGSDRSMWDPQVAALRPRFDVIAVDTRGHGHSPVVDGPYTVAELAGDVVALLDDLGIERAHIVGLSLGGAIAQHLAITSPQRIESLVLCCTAARFGEPQPWLERAATVRARGTGAIAAAVVDRWFTPELAGRDPELIARMVDLVTSTPDEGYAACCDALAAWDSRADLGRIVAPTLVIGGAQDPAVSVATITELADGIVGSRLEILSPGAHLASYERAGATSELIIEHLDGIGARRDASARGMRNRRAVLGDAHVDRSVAATTPVTAVFQDFITRTAWGDVWDRPGLDHLTRRLLTVAVLTATGNHEELDMHLRAALRADVAADTLAEVLLHTAIYAGVPNSNNGFRMLAAAVEDAGRR